MDIVYFHSENCDTAEANKEQDDRQWRAGPCVAGEANSKFGAPLFVTVANLLETSISNYLLYGILLFIFDLKD